MQLFANRISTLIPDLTILDTPGANIWLLACIVADAHFNLLGPSTTGTSQTLLVLRFTIMLFLVAEVNGNAYWRNPFNTICAQKSLVEFTVMEIEPIYERPAKSGVGAVSSKVNHISGLPVCVCGFSWLLYYDLLYVRRKCFLYDYCSTSLFFPVQLYVIHLFFFYFVAACPC